MRLRGLRAMALPLLYNLDPQVIALMNEVQGLLRYAFQTENHVTPLVSALASSLKWAP